MKFVLDLEEETIRRGVVEQADEDLGAACYMIRQTQTTPVKEVKRRQVSGVYH